MAKVKLNSSKLNDLELLQALTDLKAGLTGNANFPTPAPTLVAGGAIIADLAAKITADSVAHDAAKLATANKHISVQGGRVLATQWVTYVNLIANGNEAIALSSGLALVQPPSPAGLPGQVQNLSVTASDFTGAVDLQWDPLAGTTSYDLESSADPFTDTSWVRKDSSTKSKKELEGYVSGSRQWFRVRANNSKGPGPWSDPSVKTVP